jgi:hypothetical protein
MKKLFVLLLALISLSAFAEIFNARLIEGDKVTIRLLKEVFIKHGHDKVQLNGFYTFPHKTSRRDRFIPAGKQIETVVAYDTYFSERLNNLIPVDSSSQIKRFGLDGLNLGLDSDLLENFAEKSGAFEIIKIEPSTEPEEIY